MAGLDDNGFTRKTLTEIIDSLKQKAKNEFGPEFNTRDDSVFTQLAGVLALELDEVWQGLEGAYSAYTLTGAEGVYLDDLFARHNIIRLGATAGSGTVYVESDETTVLPQNIPTSTSFVSNNDTTYTVSTAKDIDIDATSAYKILADDIVVGTTYTIYIEDDVGVIQNTTFNVATSADKDDFVNAIKTFVDAQNTAASAKSFAFPADEEFYLGFNANKKLDPLATEITFRFDPVLGNRYTSLNALAQDKGFIPLSSGGISDMTPKFDGFVSVTNVSAFLSGSNVESDAEFRARFNRLIDASAIGADAASIESAVLGVDGVVDVDIIENPTDTATAQVAAYSYKTIVMGGVDQDIAQKIFDVSPVNVSTDGSTTVPITAVSGDVFNIKFTPATQVDLDVRISYDTSDNTVLTDVEEGRIKDALTELSLNFGIGDTVFNIQLTSAIVSSLTYGRLISLTVETKRSTEAVGSYTTADFVPLFTEYPQIPQDGISFVKV